MCNCDREIFVFGVPRVLKWNIAFRMGYAKEWSWKVVSRNGHPDGSIALSACMSLMEVLVGRNCTTSIHVGNGSSCITCTLSRLILALGFSCSSIRSLTGVSLHSRHGTAPSVPVSTSHMTRIHSLCDNGHYPHIVSIGRLLEQAWWRDR